jgi:hypothetical protein
MLERSHHKQCFKTNSTNNEVDGDGSSPNVTCTMIKLKMPIIVETGIKTDIIKFNKLLNDMIRRGFIEKKILNFFDLI